jgi:signal transduction histidine kinase
VLGIVSHDLRNPLTSILLSASLLEEAADGEMKEQVQIIRIAAQRMQRLIRDLLDVARMEGRRLTLKLQPIDSREVAVRACDEHRSIASQRGQIMACEVPPDLPPICGDHDRILQLFGNLIGNALKFTPDGGRITVRGDRQGSVIRYSVKDSGAGIPERDLPHVFERYWQAKKTAHLGAGLGLTIAKGIAESHGGSIAVSNSPDGGAVFSFTIPIAGV